MENNTFYDAPNDYRNYLAHHGVKGMHWGIRHDPVRVGRRKRGKTLMSKLFNTQEHKKKNVNDIKKSLPQPKESSFISALERFGYERKPITFDGLEDKTALLEKNTNGRKVELFTLWDGLMDIRRETSQHSSPYSDKQVANLQKYLVKNQESIKSKIIKDITPAIVNDQYRDGNHSKQEISSILSEGYFSISANASDNRQKYVPATVDLDGGSIYGDHSVTVEVMIDPNTGEIKTNKNFSING